MIESVDSEKLAAEISRQCEKHGTEMDILIEVNIGAEESKGGFDQNNVEEAIRRIAQLPHIHIKGLMSIPPIEDDDSKVRAYFAATKRIFIDIKRKNIDNVTMEILSMGMSGDFPQAILEGSTQVRIGTALFGPRNYSVPQH
jgi:pyridoxal phosphate enzyme (YggS family)